MSHAMKPPDDGKVFYVACVALVCGAMGLMSGSELAAFVCSCVVVAGIVLAVLDMDMR